MFRAPNGTVAKLRAASHTSGDAARQLPRLMTRRRKRTATAVTPSQTLSQARKRRASASAVRQLQLLVRARSSCLVLRVFDMKVVHEPMKKWPEQHTSHCHKEKAREERVARSEDLC